MSSIFKQFAHPVTKILFTEWKLMYMEAQFFDVEIIYGGMWSALLWVVIRNSSARIRYVIFGNQELWTGCPDSLMLFNIPCACLPSVSMIVSEQKEKAYNRRRNDGKYGKEYSTINHP